jgi:hypothetical protein
MRSRCIHSVDAVPDTAIGTRPERYATRVLDWDLWVYLVISFSASKHLGFATSLASVIISDDDPYFGLSKTPRIL